MGIAACDVANHCVDMWCSICILMSMHMIMP
jgi:hypothetical protein